MLTHLNPSLWTVSSGSHRRWKWPPWWTLCRTVSPRSPSAWSACSSDQPARSCICPRHKRQPRQESVSRACFHFTAALRCTGRVGRAPPQIWSPLQILLVGLSVGRVLLQPVEPNAEAVKDACVAEQTWVSSSRSFCSPSPKLMRSTSARSLPLAVTHTSFR